jgi:Ni/Fe-hydrogenase 1 B-type cytochrome subunit
MQANTVTRVLVWSRWLRLSHWTIAISTLGLIATGWLMSKDILMSAAAGEIHYLLSGLLLPAVLLRLYLLFFSHGTDHLSDCEPDLHRLSQAWQVIRFYLTLGKARLPKWYSHNPLWGPLYLLLFFFLVLITASGLLLLNNVLTVGNISIHDLHWLSYLVIFWFTLLHLPAVFAHDLSGQGGDISGMVNGYRIFDTSELQTSAQSGEQSIALDDLIKTLEPRLRR